MGFSKSSSGQGTAVSQVPRASKGRGNSPQARACDEDHRAVEAHGEAPHVGFLGRQQLSVSHKDFRISKRMAKEEERRWRRGI